ncbi:adenosine kinase [Acinetobacter gyllenbergii]|uniref:adenosine kinase n=1 Tax=Acinetobacter gyllenbergii TaxID=134534 RepID=UPI0021CE27D1|nr:adenosine kinase [Acinetobacter gyllenbergii]MCU4582945.1 adenosine kinase [Acinetobacter gyllenbergii]
MATVDLFAIGNALIDQEFKVSNEFLTQHALQKGTMQLADGETQADLYQKLQATQTYKGQASGGSAANTTVAFSALGGTAFYGCRVGDDELGTIYLDGLNEAGIKTTTQSISEGITGTCMVLISPDSERTMQTYLGITAELSTEQIDLAPLNTAKWLYIEGYLSTSDTARVAVKQARELAKAQGVKIALSLSDPAMVQYARQGLEELLDDGVDLLFCNEQEALMFTETDNLEAAIESLSFKNKQVVITQGAKGAVIVDGAHHFHVNGRAVEAVDTNGAGDAFSGAFLYAINAGLSLEAAAQLAILISSEVVAQFGPRLSVENYAKLFEQFQKAQQECA